MPSWYKTNLPTVESTDSVEAWKKNHSAQIDSESDKSEVSTNMDMPTSVIGKVQLVVPLFKFMIPLSIVYFAEYLINQGLTAFLVFDCAHGFNLSKSSQYRFGLF